MSAQLSGFGPILRRWWWLVLVSMVVGGVLGYYVASRVQPAYEARVQLLVGPINTDIDTLRASTQLAQTYAALATSQPLLTETVRELQLPMLPSRLREDVNASANSTTRVLTIRVQNEDAVLAAKIANTLAARLAALPKHAAEGAGPFFSWGGKRWFPGQHAEFAAFLGGPGAYARWVKAHPDIARFVGYGIAAGAPVATTAAASPSVAGQLQTVASAQPPGSRVGPQRRVITVLGGLAGLLGAVTMILLFEYFSPTIKSEQELAEIAPVTFLGSIDGLGRRSGRLGHLLPVEARPESAAAAGYRLLAAKIDSYDGGQPLRTLLVIGEGKGSGELAANLAAVFAAAGRHVTLIDANSDGAEITRLFGLQDEPGMSELLQDRGATIEKLCLERSPGMDIVPLGGGAEDYVLEPDRARKLLDRLVRKGELIVLNAAPVDRSSSTLAWARTADATLLVAHRGVSTRQSVTDAVEDLRLVGANLIGTVLT